MQNVLLVGFVVAENWSTQSEFYEGMRWGDPDQKVETVRVEKSCVLNEVKTCQNQGFLGGLELSFISTHLKNCRTISIGKCKTAFKTIAENKLSDKCKSDIKLTAKMSGNNLMELVGEIGD